MILIKIKETTDGLLEIEAHGDGPTEQEITLAEIMREAALRALTDLEIRTSTIPGNS